MEQLQNLKDALAAQDALIVKLSDRIDDLEGGQAVDLSDAIAHVEANNDKLQALLPLVPAPVEPAVEPAAEAEPVIQAQAAEASDVE